MEKNRVVVLFKFNEGVEAVVKESLVKSIPYFLKGCESERVYLVVFDVGKKRGEIFVFKFVF